MKHWTKAILGLAMLALLVGVWVAPVSAAPPNLQAPPDTNRAKYAYKLALLRLEAQQDRIDHANAAADLIQEYIDDELAAGYDPSSLEEALLNLRALLDEAQDYHNLAAQIFDEGAGFDDEGNVTESQQARETMRDGNRAMRDAGRALREGRREFRHAMREYGRSKRSE